jgi:hypothetical protein
MSCIWPEALIGWSESGDLMDKQRVWARCSTTETLVEKYADDTIHNFTEAQDD